MPLEDADAVSSAQPPMWNDGASARRVHLQQRPRLGGAESDGGCEEDGGENARNQFHYFTS